MSSALPTDPHAQPSDGGALHSERAAVEPGLAYHTQDKAQELTTLDDEYDEHIPSAWALPKLRPTSPLLKWLLLPMMFIALVLSLSFVLRTRAIVGPLIQQIIITEATRRGIDLYIEDMRPSGLFGVRLDRVRARIKRGHYILDTRMTRVEISPDLWASLQQRRPIPGTIHLYDSDILIERSPERGASNKARPEELKGSLAKLGELHVIGHDVRLQLKAGRSFSSTRPLLMQRIEARIPLQHDPLPNTLQAYGKLPDHTPFSLTSAPDTKTGGRRYILKPQHTTRLDHWFIDQVPFEMTSQELTICSGCGTDEIALGQVTLKLPNFGKGLNITASDSVLQWDQGKATLLLPGVKIQGIQDPSVAVELKRTHFMFDTATGSHTGELELSESSGGVLDLTWLWDGLTRQFSGALEAKRFSLKPFFSLWEATPLLMRGTLNGTLNGIIDPKAKLIELTSDMALLEARGQWPQLSPTPIELERVHIKGTSLLDLAGKSISLSDLELRLGEAQPLTLQATLQKLNKGYTFELEAKTEALNLQTLLRQLPPELSGVFSDARFEGGLDLELKTAGHTEFPESLRLDISAGGDLNIAQDGSRANIAAMTEPGMPWAEEDRFDPPIKAADWVIFAELPAHVPRTITAAEDAQFYKHNGFDLLGLSRAMTHNMRVKKMERGGSTITQQVVKNVFLSRERTLSRKAQEALLTWRAEQLLGKERILEIYLNIAEWGPGMRGISQAAQGYFKTSAQELTLEQTAFLGAILPGPKLYGPQIKAGYIASSRVTKFEHIMANLRFLGFIDTDEYYKLVGRALRGQLAGLELTVCADDDTAPEGAVSCKKIGAEHL